MKYQKYCFLVPTTSKIANGATRQFKTLTRALYNMVVPGGSNGILIHFDSLSSQSSTATRYLIFRWSNIGFCRVTGLKSLSRCISRIFVTLLKVQERGGGHPSLYSFSINDSPMLRFSSEDSRRKAADLVTGCRRTSPLHPQPCQPIGSIYDLETCWWVETLGNYWSLAFKP